MAGSCNYTYALASSCRVGLFPSIVSKVVVDQKVSSRKSRVPACEVGRKLSVLNVALDSRKISPRLPPRSLHSSNLISSSVRHGNAHHIFQLEKTSGNLGPQKVAGRFKGFDSCQKMRGNGGSIRATLDADLSEQISGQGRELRPLQIALAMGVLVAADKGTALGIYRWNALPSVVKGLPSSTVCMALLLASLLAIDYLSPKVSKSITSFFGPAVELLQRWMPLFYTPPLVMMSLVVQDMGVHEGVGLLLLIVGAWAMTLASVALLASAVRQGVQTRLGDTANMPSAAPFGLWEMLTWAGVGAGSGLIFYVAPTAFGLHPATVALPFFVCATVTGFLLGSQVPGPLKKILHPVLTCACFVNVVAFLAGIFTNQSFESVLGLYFTKNMKAPGAGDLLMAFLGPLTLSYAFTLFRQRGIVRRHATELGAVIPIAGLFSLLVTAVGGRQLGINATLTSSVAGRSTSLAFGLPICNTLGGEEPLAASAGIITGLLGANLSLWVLSILKIQDGIARGLATACSSHGFGSAAVAAGEQDLLPFCAVAYILMGAVCSVAVSIPSVRSVVFQP